MVIVISLLAAKAIKNYSLVGGKQTASNIVQQQQQTCAVHTDVWCIIVSYCTTDCIMYNIIIAVDYWKQCIHKSKQQVTHESWSHNCLHSCI